jgi:hypothetical protein
MKTRVQREQSCCMCEQFRRELKVLKRNIVGQENSFVKGAGYALLMAALAAVFSIQPAEAQPAAKGAKDVPALYGDPKHADISGMWDPPGFTPGGPPPPQPAYTPEYQAKIAEQRRLTQTGNPPPDNVAQCLAFGMPRFATMPVEIIQTPGQVTLNLGVLHDIRRIYLDGRHTDFADPSFNGDSIGRWEGDTLVVETNNIRAGQLSQLGGLYSDKITAVERFRRIAPDKLEHIMTLTDPEAFSTPFVQRRVFTLMPAGSRFEEYICENRRD